MAKMYGDKFCSNYRYDKSNCEKSETWAAVMWVSYGLGAALITTGIVMLVSASKQERAVRRRISWTPLLGNHNVALAISGRW